jgi:hypothetical protein
MRIEKITWTEEFRIFEEGDKVKPSSRRCVLDDGVYEVVSCHIPQYPGDEVIVFVKGHECGVSGEYLTLA